jgi:peptide deformylase
MNMLVHETDPILHRPSQLVDLDDFDNEKPTLQIIARTLIDTIIETNAIGVSACQVGFDRAIFATAADGTYKICINPTIVAASLEMAREVEGCLSYPGLVLRINRPTSVVTRYVTLDGEEVTERLDGLAARVWLHEYDHINGTCFVDRVSKLSRDMAKKKLIKSQRKKR